MRRYLYNYYRSHSKKLDFSKNYVYFPLHYEPERTSNPEGGDYYNIIDALISLRAFVPEHIPIYVKEHPSQFARKLYGYRGRSPYFYDIISSMTNVHLARLSVSSEKLILNALFVASLTGTANLEASILGRKSLLFGYTWFSGFPNIFNFDKLYNYRQFIDEPIEPVSKIIQATEKYLADLAFPGTVNPSGESYFKKKFPDMHNDLLDDKTMASFVVSGILDDLGVQ